MVVRTAATTTYTHDFLSSCCFAPPTIKVKFFCQLLSNFPALHITSKVSYYLYHSTITKPFHFYPKVAAGNTFYGEATIQLQASLIVFRWKFPEVDDSKKISGIALVPQKVNLGSTHCVARKKKVVFKVKFADKEKENQKLPVTLAHVIELVYRKKKILSSLDSRQFKLEGVLTE